MSISKAQAEALADGFLDTVGSGSRDDLKPRNTFTELILIAGELAEDATQNLNNQKKNSTGELASSITVQEPQAVGKSLKTNITMLFYGKFVNSGVRGTKSGSSTAGYKFRNEFPSKKMVKAIQSWIDVAKISTRTTKKEGVTNRGYGSHEKKQVSVSESGLAYAVAKSVKLKGLKPTGFMDKAIVTAKGKISNRLGAALKVDIINAISG